MARSDPCPTALTEARGPGSLRSGELVILHDRAGRTYNLTLRAGASYSMHAGTFAHDSLIGQQDGSLVETTGGTRLLALRPTFAERVVGRRRRAQPIYPKDLGAILVNADLYPGANVLEAGSGTGALTIAALRAIGSSGRMVTYEVREDFQSAAREAIADAFQGELPPSLAMKLGDVYLGIDEPEPFDRALLDLPEPWQAIAGFAAVLRPGGILFAHCPNVSQVQRFSEGLREHGGFGLIRTIEVLERSWTIRGRSMRPDHRMVAHTGFLTFVRRLAGDEVFEADRNFRD